MLCDAEWFNKVQGFTWLSPAQESMLRVAATTAEKEVGIFNRVNSLSNRFLGGVTDAAYFGGRRRRNLMWAGVTCEHCSC